MPSDIDDTDVMDPTQFLAQNDDNPISNEDESHPILNALGLTQINNVSKKTKLHFIVSNNLRNLV